MKVACVRDRRLREAFDSATHSEDVDLVVTGDALILELDDGETLEFALQGFEEALNEAKSDMSDEAAA